MSLDKPGLFQQNGVPETVLQRSFTGVTPMSDHAASTTADVAASHAPGNAPGNAPASPKVDASRVWVDDGEGHGTAMALASPEFDEPEVAAFGNDDTHAVTVIGKMLVGFFFYSFLVMLAVALWTMSRGGQVDPNASHTEHAEEAEE
jgi:hypothetical protein